MHKITSYTQLLVAIHEGHVNVERFTDAYSAEGVAVGSLRIEDGTHVSFHIPPDRLREMAGAFSEFAMSLYALADKRYAESSQAVPMSEVVAGVVA
jgi:hypothetical protein